MIPPGQNFFLLPVGREEISLKVLLRQIDDGFQMVMDVTFTSQFRQQLLCVFFIEAGG